MLGGLLAERGHTLAGVIMSPHAMQSLPTAIEEAIEYAAGETELLLAARRSSLAPLLRALEPDLILCERFAWRVPDDALAAAPMGGLNGHASLLPRARGPNPIGWSLREGDELGYTVHRMVNDFDAGRIMAQKTLPLSDEDSFLTLLPRFREAALASFREALERVEAGDPGRPQDASKATQARDFEEAYRELDWSQSARALHRQVRAWYGMGAFGVLEGGRYRVVRTRLPVSDARTGATPGTILSNSEGVLTVQCGEGVLELVEAAPDEGEEVYLGRLLARRAADPTLHFA